MTPKSSYRRSRLAPRLIKAIVEAKVGELQGSLFFTRERDNLQRSSLNGILFSFSMDSMENQGTKKFGQVIQSMLF
jgi:hypothetical protein